MSDTIVQSDTAINGTGLKSSTYDDDMNEGDGATALADATKADTSVISGRYVGFLGNTANTMDVVEAPNTAPYTNRGFAGSVDNTSDAASNPNTAPYTNHGFAPSVVSTGIGDPAAYAAPVANPGFRGILDESGETDAAYSVNYGVGGAGNTVVISQTEPLSEAYPNSGIDGDNANDPAKGAAIGAVAGGIVGGLAGGPVGLVLGALAGAAASGAAVAGVDMIDDDHSVGETHTDPATGVNIVQGTGDKNVVV